VVGCLRQATPKVFAATAGKPNSGVAASLVERVFPCWLSEQFIGAFGINVSQFSVKFYPNFFSGKKAMHIESYVHESAENS